VSDLPSDVEWSPADDPYSIAVSEAWWWRNAVRLAIRRMNTAPDATADLLGAQQIDARNLIFALVQLLAAEHLEQKALTELGMDGVVGQVLARAREQYLEALPGIQDMRNAITHFDEWAMGQGHGLQRREVDGGASRRDVAGHFWGLGYHAGEQVVRLGPFTIAVDRADSAARDLQMAIYAAAQAVDHRRPETPSDE
jgi:hypothetical protein